MKQFITAPQLKSLARNTNREIFYCGYCELQHLTNACDCVFYNAGVYGWNYDVFELPDGSYLVTGYRVPRTIGQYIRHDFCTAIDEHARRIQADNFVWYDIQNKIRQSYTDYYKTLIESTLAH